jgi:hypothetical protein
VFIVEHLDKNSSNIMIYIAAKYNNKWNIERVITW